MRTVFQSLVLTLCVALPASAPASAQQTCRSDIPASAPDSRDTDNGDGNVTDRATGLMWKRCAEGLSGADCATGSAPGFTWQRALQAAADAVFAGRSDWRLPNVKELASLVEQRCVVPAINTRLFPSAGGWFWASSASIYPDSAWSVYFDNCYVYNHDKLNADQVRLVRGGQ